jgi:ATP-binding cassette, subfamily C, bacterial
MRFKARSRQEGKIVGLNRSGLNQAWAFATNFAISTRSKFLLSLALILVVGLTEGISIVLLVPLLSLVGVRTSGATTGQLRDLVSQAFQIIGLKPTLLTVLALYVLVTSARGLLQAWQNILMGTLPFQFAADLRRQLYRDILHANWPFLSHRRAADFVHVLTAQMDRVAVAAQSLLSLAAAITMALVYLLFALKLSPIVTLVVLATGGVLALLLRGRVHKAHALGVEVSKITQDLYAAVIQHLDGIKIVKSYGAEDVHLGIFSSINRRVAEVFIRVNRNYAWNQLGSTVGSTLIMSAMLIIALQLLHLSTGTLLLLLFLFARTIPLLSGVQQNYQHFVSTVPAFSSIVQVRDDCLAQADQAARRHDSVGFHNCIELQGVDFRYAPGSRNRVLSDVSLLVPFGETVAVVGPSGAGKSTIADLLLGLLEPQEGHVLIDGEDLTAERLPSWRSQIGYVTQETFLFHDTIRANLLWARPGASSRELERALQMAAAEGFVSDLSLGMETVVGDRGVTLSGGERQRLALARALVRQPKLLILDEATSAVDPENEARIQTAVERLHGKLTIVLITHRLNIVRGADRIYVVESGRVVESGKWEALLARPGRLAAMYQAQEPAARQLAAVIEG